MQTAPLIERFSLADRTALVTGSSRGIGRAIALLFATAGATVAVNARHAEGCEEVVDEITTSGGRAIAVPGHVGSAEGCETMVASVIAQTGRLDLLVNNAGIKNKFRFTIAALA